METAPTSRSRDGEAQRHQEPKHTVRAAGKHRCSALTAHCARGAFQRGAQSQACIHLGVNNLCARSRNDLILCTVCQNVNSPQSVWTIHRDARDHSTPQLAHSSVRFPHRRHIAGTSHTSNTTETKLRHKMKSTALAVKHTPQWVNEEQTSPTSHSRDECVQDSPGKEAHTRTTLWRDRKRRILLLEIGAVAFRGYDACQDTLAPDLHSPRQSNPRMSQSDAWHRPHQAVRPRQAIRTASRDSARASALA